MLMRIKNMQSSNAKAFFQLGVMMLLTIFTQAIMLIKTSVLASNFGVSVEMDAFNFSNNIGTFIYSFIGAGVTTVLIPNLINKDKKESINIFLSVLYSIAFMVLIVVHVFRGELVRGLSSGSEEFILLTCNIMFITLITQYINSFTGATNAIFQCSGKFNFPKFVTLITSATLVLLLIFTPNITIYRYAQYLLVTTTINVLLQLYLVVKGGYSFKFKIDFKDKEFQKMMRIFAPTVLSTGLYQISLLTGSIISSNLGEGEISKLSYSNNIMTLINTVIITNIMTFFYPKIARDVEKDNSQKNLFDLSILINAIMILIVVGYFTVGKQAITLLYQRGKFTADITSIVYGCTLIYIFAIPINTFRDLIYRYFYAKGDTLNPFKNSLIISCLNIVISIILSRFMGIYGIILSTVITGTMSLIMIMIRFSKKFNIKYSKKVLLIENVKLSAAAAISIILIKFFENFMLDINIFVYFIMFGLLSVVSYFIIIYIMKSKVFKIKLGD